MSSRYCHQESPLPVASYEVHRGIRWAWSSGTSKANMHLQDLCSKGPKTSFTFNMPHLHSRHTSFPKTLCFERCVSRSAARQCFILPCKTRCNHQVVKDCQDLCGDEVGMQRGLLNQVSCEKKTRKERKNRWIQDLPTGAHPDLLSSLTSK